MGTGRAGRRAIGVILCSAALIAGCTNDDAADDADGSETTTTAASEDVNVLGVDDLGYRATIRRTEGGVAHITADNLANLSFGQGWASGEDRACDLADQVVKVNGERARWFGPGKDDANIESDVAWRSIGIRTIAGGDWDTTTSEVRELISAYTDGWNAQLAEVGTDGLNDWCAGEDWVRPLEPVEVYAYARSIALQASSGAVASFIAGAQPPSGTSPEGTNASFTAPDTTAAPLAGPVAPIEPVVASNGWAIGTERSVGGGGMLVANPHFPWEGQLRFWEVHLTVPGEVDIYGVQLSGLPGIAIGFTENFGWTHTVSAGSRFTAYKVDLVAGSPTTYRYGDDEREMTSQDLPIEVLGDDGAITTQTRTVYRTHYGPVLDFPGVGWTADSTITIRDANIENNEFIEQYMGMMQADDLDELIALHRDINGVPLFNTIATSADGRAWYGDTSATPNLSPEALQAYAAALETDPLTAIAKQSGAVLLDGSDPTFEWQDAAGARDPGLVPYSDMPVVERDDYLFNANDSFWMANATEMTDGDYSLLHGAQRTARSPRTRENATILGDVSASGPSGSDGKFDLDELAAASIQDTGFTARALLDDLVERCDAAPPVVVEQWVGGDGIEILPAASVDLAPACTVLAAWDGVYDIDRAGPALFREFASRYESKDLLAAGPLWAQPFDPADPVATPSGLAPAPADGVDPALSNLTTAVQILAKAGHGPEVALGELQAADRNGTAVPIHGGNAVDGTTNVVGYGAGWSTLDPSLLALERTPLAPRSPLAEVKGGGATTTGYRINNGSSFLMALEFTDDGPRAKTFLTYGNTADRGSPAYVDATRRFGAKEWKDVAFTEEDVAAAATETVTVIG